MDIETLIKAAQDRDAKAAAEREATARQARAKSVDTFHEQIDHLFGDLPTILNMSVELPDLHERASTATFTFRNRLYSLSNRSSGDTWILIRLDERAEDDERRLPCDTLHPHHRIDYRDGNIHQFLIALATLDAEPDAEPRPSYTAGISHQTTAERLAEALTDFIRDIGSADSGY